MVRNPPASLFPANPLTTSGDPNRSCFLVALDLLSYGCPASLLFVPCTLLQFVLSEDDMIDVAGVGYEPVGEFTACGRLVTPRSSPTVSSLLEAACLCNNAVLGDKAAGGGGDMR